MKLLSPLDQMFARMEAPHITSGAVFDLPKEHAQGSSATCAEAISQWRSCLPVRRVIAGGASMAYWRQVQPDPATTSACRLPYPGTARDLARWSTRRHGPT